MVVIFLPTADCAVVMHDADGDAVHVHGAGAALADAAAELRAGEAEVLAQDPEQRHVAAHVHVVAFAVYVESDHVSAPCRLPGFGPRASAEGFAGRRHRSAVGGPAPLLARRLLQSRAAPPELEKCGRSTTRSLAIVVGAVAVLGLVRPAAAQNFPPDPLAVRMPDDAVGVDVEAHRRDRGAAGHPVRLRGSGRAERARVDAVQCAHVRIRGRSPWSACGRDRWTSAGSRCARRSMPPSRPIAATSGATSMASSSCVPRRRGATPSTRCCVMSPSRGGTTAGTKNCSPH